MKACRRTVCAVARWSESTVGCNPVSPIRINSRFLSADNRNKCERFEGLPNSEVTDFNLRKVVLMQKVTRYEYEKHHFREISDDEEKFREMVSITIFNMIYHGAQGSKIYQNVSHIYTHVQVNRVYIKAEIFTVLSLAFPHMIRSFTPLEPLSPSISP